MLLGVADEIFGRIGFKICGCGVLPWWVKYVILIFNILEVKDSGYDDDNDIEKLIMIIECLQQYQFQNVCVGDRCGQICNFDL